MTNLQITQLTPAMTTAAHQAAQILHDVFAPQGSWETMAEAISPASSQTLVVAASRIFTWASESPE